MMLREAVFDVGDSVLWSMMKCSLSTERHTGSKKPQQHDAGAEDSADDCAEQIGLLCALLCSGDGCVVAMRQKAKKQASKWPSVDSLTRASVRDRTDGLFTGHSFTHHSWLLSLFSGVYILYYN